MEIIIGSDEIILWLRKNKKAIGQSNDVIGKRIRNIIEKELEIGSLEKHNKQSHWTNETGNKNISNVKLPKTSAQYLIRIKDIESLYKALDKEFKEKKK